MTLVTSLVWTNIADHLPKAASYTSEVLGYGHRTRDIREFGRRNLSVVPSDATSGADRQNMIGKNFGRELHWYAAENDLEPENGTQLQRHMRDWTDKRWADPPDDQQFARA